MIQNRMRTKYTHQIPKELERRYSDIAAQRVQKGAALLDRTIPDWFNKIDPDTLSMEQSRHWIIAQATGRGFYFGTYMLGITSTKRMVHLGYYCDSEGIHLGAREEESNDLSVVDHYILLQDHWLKEIESRLSSCKHDPKQVNQTEETWSLWQYIKYQWPSSKPE